MPDLEALRLLAERPGMPELLSALGPNEARFVGGIVRDTLIGIPSADIDLATRLSPYEVMRRCGAAGIRTVPTGIAHGTVTALSSGGPVEITTLRADLATDGRHATVAFTDDWKADAERRDFTINALYYDPASQSLDDWFGGLDDLDAGTVRFIGAPLERIAEDHLRILRFFRFTARFASNGPDAEGFAACQERANDLMALSRERIADEWLKLLALSAPTSTVWAMIEGAILLPVMPEIELEGVTRLQALIEAETAARVPPHPLRRFAALLPPDPAVAERIAARLKLSNKARQRLAAATTPLEAGTPPRAIAYASGIEIAQDRLLLAGRPEDAGALGDWSVPRLPIGGGVLIARGIAPGPDVAKTLKTIERVWIGEDFPGEERLEEIVAAALFEAKAGGGG